MTMNPLLETTSQGLDLDREIEIVGRINRVKLIEEIDLEVLITKTQAGIESTITENQIGPVITSQ